MHMKSKLVHGGRANRGPLWSDNWAKNRYNRYIENSTLCILAWYGMHAICVMHAINAYGMHAIYGLHAINGIHAWYACYLWYAC